MKTVRWSQEDGAGLEHLVLNADTAGALIESVVTGEDGEASFGLIYRIECDARWHVTRFAARLTSGETLDLRREANASAAHAWIDANGTQLHALDGCIDVDLTATPYTNTLPIRRLRLEEGERHVIRVVYVKAPTLEVSVAEQAYTCLEPNRRYRYEGLDTGFSAELTVDDNCIVQDYPGLFRRIGR
jgi:uncharacterized protein